MRRALAVPRVVVQVVPLLASVRAVAQPAPPVLRDGAASTEHLALPEPLALQAVGQPVEARQEVLPRAPADEAEAAGQPAVAP